MLQQSNQSQETIMLTFIPPNSLQQGRINSTSIVQRKDSLGAANPSTEEKYQAIINGHSDHYPSLEEKHIFITKEMVEEKLREEAEQQRRMMENEGTK
jgi:DNA polymerase sigma